jgi:kinesin family member 3B
MLRSYCFLDSIHLWALQDVSQEVEQKYADWQTDKANFLEDYSILQSQMRLKQLEIDLFIPIEEVNKVMHNAKWNDERELWIMDTSVNAKRNVKSAKRPVSASGLRRPTTDFTKTANAMGDLNPRFRLENILSLELDLPERTTFDYESLEERGDIQAALNMAYPQDTDVIFAGDGSMQGLYTEEGHSTTTKAAAPWPHSDARTPSGRQRPASARRKS